MKRGPFGEASILHCRLANVETTFQGFAGADYDLQVSDHIYTEAIAPSACRHQGVNCS